jgi:exopolysaccharide/PEP-CTERM locus tyrosine autokinase
MSLIEQAAKRLEELRRAGVELPTVRPKEIAAGAPASDDETIVEIERGYKGRARVESAARPVLPNVPQALNDTPFEPRRQSKAIEIDLARLAGLGYVTPDAPRSQLADEYRVIKRPLLTNALGKSSTRLERGNLILLTSALPGEGKTFTSINLALSMAVELDCTVLLVDADVARPAVLNRLGLPNTKGLLDVLTDSRLHLSDVLLRTNVERLSILPAGTHHPRATELLASDGMSRLVDELATRYADRIVVFDAPPLLPSTESRVLATHMGQIVLVVDAATQRSTLTRALATIENCPVVMTLLNKVVGSEVGSYSEYYTNGSP